VGFWAVVGLVAGLVAVGLLSLMIWGLAYSEWSEVRRGPRPYQPAKLIALLLDDWYESPKPINHAGRGSTAGVEMGVVTRVSGGEYSGDAGTTTANFLLTYADGTATSINGGDLNPRRFRPGLFLPVRREEGELADDLSLPDLRGVLIAHRASLGLLDECEQAALAEGSPTLADLTSLSATGRVRHGHLEIEADIDVDGTASQVVGFLRPDMVTSARFSSFIPVTRTGNNERPWVLWPTWY
jgi:hypothetical protein